MSIHPTAIVDPNAKIGRDVTVGPYSIVGAHVTLGDGCKLHQHVTVDGHTTMGEGCEVYPQAVIGLAPQDLKYGGERTLLNIGAGNVFRETVTVHPGTANGGGVTHIGDGNFFLIGVHVAHDCRIGNQCIIANLVQLAGHVHLEDSVNLGGQAGVHHFVTVGKHAFVGAMTKVTADAPPFMVIVAARGTRPETRMVNGVGLQRSGYGAADIQELKSAFMKLFSRRARQSGTAIRDRVKVLLTADPLNPHVRYLCDFLMRSFDGGRHGRYLESQRVDKVHRDTWKPNGAFNLSVQVVGRGTVDRFSSVNSSATHEVLRLTAAPDPGWRFAGWNGSLSGGDNPVSIVLDTDKIVTATFTPSDATMPPSTAPAGGQVR